MIRSSWLDCAFSVPEFGLLAYSFFVVSGVWESFAQDPRCGSRRGEGKIGFAFLNRVLARSQVNNYAIDTGAGVIMNMMGPSHPSEEALIHSSLKNGHSTATLPLPAKVRSSVSYNDILLEEPRRVSFRISFLSLKNRWECSRKISTHPMPPNIANRWCLEADSALGDGFSQQCLIFCERNYR